MVAQPEAAVGLPVHAVFVRAEPAPHFQVYEDFDGIVPLEQPMHTRRLHRGPSQRLAARAEQCARGSWLGGCLQRCRIAAGSPLPGVDDLAHGGVDHSVVVRPVQEPELEQRLLRILR